MACPVERSDEFVAVPRGALRELLGAGEVEPDTFELRGRFAAVCLLQPL